MMGVRQYIRTTFAHSPWMLFWAFVFLLGGFLSGKCLTAAADNTFFGNEFVLTSSAVTIDPAKNLILLIHKPAASAYYFPQTYKLRHETSDYAVTRLILEWTGLITSHLPLFTAPNGYDYEQKEEPMAVTTQYSETHDKTMITSWYLLKGDSTAVPMKFMQQQEDGIEVVWMTFEAAIENLSFEGEAQLAERVMEALEEKKTAAVKKSDEAIAKIVEEVLEMEKTEGRPVMEALKEGITKAAMGMEFRDFLQSLDEMPDPENPDHDSDKP